MKKYSLFLFSIFLLVACAPSGSSNAENKGSEESSLAEVESAEEAKIFADFASSSLIVQDDIIIFPEPNGLAEVKIDTLGEELPTSKEDGDLPVMLSFTAGGATLNTYGEIKVQGSSTARWPKKNWTLKFYADEARTEKLRLKIGNSVVSDKWIAKAEWIDPSMLRNGLSYRLWEAMVQSRNVYPQYEVDHAWVGKNNMQNGIQTGAQGFPKSHPMQVKVNDEHYGLSMLLLGHDPRNFNIDADNPEHIYMEFDARGGYTDTKTWEKFSAEGVGEWIDGYYPKNDSFTDEQLEAINSLGELLNGSLTDFEENFDQYLDKTNMIDMLLFLEMIYDWDAVAQDIEMVTYDSQKWYMLPWDKDTTFGMNWDGSGIREESAEELLINYDAEDPSQKPWYKTYHAFTPEVEARYAQLRNEGVFSTNNLYRLTKDITEKVPKEMWEQERRRWEGDGRPSVDETSSSQIISWFEQRLETLDSHFQYYPY